MNHDPRGLSEHLAWMRQRNLRDATIRHRAYDIRRLARFLQAEPFDATDDDLHQWRASLVKSPAAVYREISYVQQFYRWGVDYEWISRDPSRRLIKPRLGRRLPRPMGEVDLLIAIHNAPERIRPWLILAAFEGLRAREIAYLRREDVLDTADPPMIHVSTLAGKGGRERLVPLSALTIEELHRAGMPRSGWMFTRRDDQPGSVSPGQVSRLCSEHLKAVGASGTLHGLRHRFATVAYDQSHDLRVVQELLGHADPANTAPYVGWSHSAAVEVVVKVGQSLNLSAKRLTVV